jgi:hypothetical protein
MAWPIPLFAPVTSAVLFDSFSMATMLRRPLARVQYRFGQP